MRDIKLDTITHTIATAGGIGHIGRMPGTLGSLLGAGLAVLFYILGGQDTVWFMALFTLVVGALATHLYLIRLNNKDPHYDPGEIVVDEVAGMLLVFAMCEPTSLVIVILNFGLFRLFDIKKYGPVGWADRKMVGAAGVMTDDTIAALFAGFSVLLLDALLYEAFHVAL